MSTRGLLLLITVTLAITARARGELYDFKLEARVFNSVLAHPAVGETLTVTFRADRPTSSRSSDWAGTPQRVPPSRTLGECTSP
jgi:hypothetical protein